MIKESLDFRAEPMERRDRQAMYNFLLGSSTVIRNCFSVLAKSSHAAPRAGATRRRRPCILERLEHRVLLSVMPTVFMVTDNSDNAMDTGSLRFAINQANNNTSAGGSLIEFDPSVFNTTTPQTIKLMNGKLELMEAGGPEMIDGPGESALTISGNNMSLVFGVKDFVTASISGVTISGGNTNAAYDGGGIYDAGTLAVTDCMVTDNSAGYGGGIGSAGTLTITGSQIEDNVSKAATGTGGGVDLNTDATATITGCTIEGNSALGPMSVGGGIANITGSTMTIINSTIGGSSAGAANSSVMGGGGIYNGGRCTLTIIGCTIAGNKVTGSMGEGGGIENGASGTLAVTNSTISGNSAKAMGGGIQTSGTAAVVTNSTIADNVAEFGGGIETETVVTVDDSTIADNSATDAGGGLFVDNNDTATLDNTIVAQNTSGAAATPDDITIGAGATVSGSNNLIGTGGGGGLMNGVDGNQVGVASPGLGALADNGGPTETIALLPGSPAIDKGNNSLIPAGLDTDQRGTGFVRIFNGTVDIGAFELQPPAVVAITVDWGVDSASLDTASDGLRLLPAGRNTDLPWLGIDQFQITLNQPDTLTAADVTVKGLKVKNYGPVVISGSGTSYTITLARRIKVADRLTITIAAPNFVTYIRRLDVLPGDFDDNGVVNKRDVKDVRNEFHRTGGAQPTIFGDIVGDGTVDARDVKATQRLVGTRLPKLSSKHRV